jgi:hypothetical protein
MGTTGAAVAADDDNGLLDGIEEVAVVVVVVVDGALEDADEEGWLREVLVKAPGPEGRAEGVAPAAPGPAPSKGFSSCL